MDKFFNSIKSFFHIKRTPKKKKKKSSKSILVFVCNEISIFFSSLVTGLEVFGNEIFICFKYFVAGLLFWIPDDKEVEAKPKKVAAANKKDVTLSSIIKDKQKAHKEDKLKQKEKNEKKFLDRAFQKAKKDKEQQKEDSKKKTILFSNKDKKDKTKSTPLFKKREKKEKTKLTTPNMNFKTRFVWLYNHTIGKPINEFIDIFRYATAGVVLIFMGIFYDFPKMLYVKVPAFFKNAGSNGKDQLTLFKQWLNEAPGKFKKSIQDRFNNSIFIKNYRNKKLLQFENLTAMQIDRNSADAVRSANKITFRYLVKNADGKFIKGYFSAFSKLDCHSYLLDEGYEVYKIETSKWIEFLHGDSKFVSKKMSKKDLIFWLTQLSTYIKSGVPLTDAAKILSAQDKRRKYKKLYDELIYELTMGESFARALEKQGDAFPALLINMIKAAEMMGDLENTLDDMSEYYSEIESTKKQMKSAMTYPAIVGVFSIVIITFILTYIIPQFEGIYNQGGMEIKGVTLLVLNASAFLKTKWPLLLGIFVGIVVIIKFLYSHLKAFKTVAQYCMMHMPVLGKVMIYNEMVLFSKTFASLQKNNVLLTESIDILSKITNNEIYKVIMLDTITNLLKGDKMSDSFKDNWAIPELAYYMISTGERTGDLAAMLEKVSKYYQEQQKAMVTTLKAFIEPLLIAFLAIVVGGIIIAAILPMFSMYGEMI